MNEDDRVVISLDGSDVEATLLSIFTEGMSVLAEVETDEPAADGFTIQYRPVNEVRPAA